MRTTAMRRTRASATTWEHLRASERHLIASRSICNYLIKSDVGCSDLAPYPPLNNVYGQTGDVTELNDDDDLCLLPDTHTESVIDPYESGRMTIVMQASRAPDTELRAEMTQLQTSDFARSVPPPLPPGELGRTAGGDDALLSSRRRGGRLQRLRVDAT